MSSVKLHITIIKKQKHIETKKHISQYNTEIQIIEWRL